MGDKKTIAKKAHRRFYQLLENKGEFTRTLEYGDKQKYAIFSDFHMGDGTRADNFKQNERTVVKAMEYYRKRDYSVILLGDIEEFHQFTLDDIEGKYLKKSRGKSVYNVLQEFSENRIYRVFGNHDIEWSLQDPLCKEKRKGAFEAIKLKKGEEVHILLTHGHQAEEAIEKDLHIVRLGTSLFKFMERFLKIESKSVLGETPNFKDIIYSDWTKQSNKILICGHTHCPILASHFIDYDWIKRQYQECEQRIKTSQNPGEKNHLKRKKEWLYLKLVDIEHDPRRRYLPKSPDPSLSNHYFNTGGCLFKDAITNIEIDGDIIRLIHWYNTENKPEIFMNMELNISALITTGTRST